MNRDLLPKKSFLICPVRGATEEEKKRLEKYVIDFEKNGDGIHYPAWDTNQTDLIGYRICRDNCNAINNSSMGIKAYLNETSNGSMFDLGMTFYRGHPLEIINPEFDSSKFPEPLRTFVTNYATNLEPFNKKEYQKLIYRRDKIFDSKKIEYIFNGITPDFLFDFGMAFMSKKPIALTNRKDVKPTEGKSFQNVLLYVDSLC